MKKILLSVLSVAIAVAAKAQDVIVFRNADELQAKITAVSDNKLSYRRWDNLGGPEYTIDKAQVFYVRYQNGTKDVFEEFKPKTINPENASADFSGVKFQSYIYAGAVFNSYGGGPSVDLNFGVRAGRYFYAGIETGFHALIFSDEFFGQRFTFTEAYIPVGVNIKGYVPVGKRIYPYLNCSLGGFFGVIDLEGLNGFYCQVGAGIDVKRFSFGIGYTGLVKEGTANLGYVKLGVRLGKY